MDEDHSLDKYLGTRSCVKCGDKTVFAKNTGYNRLVRQLCPKCFKEVKKAERPMTDGWGAFRRPFGCGGGYRILKNTKFMQ